MDKTEREDGRDILHSSSTDAVDRSIFGGRASNEYIACPARLRTEEIIAGTA